MPTGTIDSAIFKDIFGTEAMRQVWSDGNRIQKYLDFEAGLARAQARLKIIPQEACDEILKHVTVEQYDIAKLKTETERIGYPVLPVVSAAREALQGRARRMVPLGRHHPGHHRHRHDHADPRGARRSSRRTSTAISDALAGARQEATATPSMAGRSNLQQAVPITFGYKCATYLAAFEAPQAAAGAAQGAHLRVRVRRRGRHAVLARQGRPAHRRSSWRKSSTSPSRRSPGTRCATASPRSAASSVSSPAPATRSPMDVKLMMQTEVEEVYEPFHEGRGSSSHHAAEAQSDLLRLHHGADRRGALTR